MATATHRALVPVTVALPIINAAAYVRMSTDMQQYSIHNQLLVIEKYASEHGFQVVQTYEDRGISGLTITERPGLRRLVSHVVAGQANFSKILVYDVSRWGRFQDADQSAFYEYLCRMNNVEVIYCAEPFSNDHTPFSTIVKAIKRVMAAEYSRELSARISRAKLTLAARGYVVGGMAKYGLRHIVVDENGKRILKVRQLKRKTRLGYRVVPVQGPKREVTVVREIFRRYVELGERIEQIVAYLADRGIRTRRGSKWCHHAVSDILLDEQYTGAVVYNRDCTKLKQTRKRNPPEDWIIRPGVFQPIIDRATFLKASARRRDELTPYTDEEMLQKLRRFLDKHGSVTQKSIYRYRNMPGAGAYAHRFGTLFAACRLVGYYGATTKPQWKERFRLRRLREDVFDQLRALAATKGIDLRPDGDCNQFSLNGSIACSFGLGRHYAKAWGDRWRLTPRRDFGIFHLWARLEAGNEKVRDYYLIPNAAIPRVKGTYWASNKSCVDRYRLPSMEAVLRRLSQALKRRARYDASN